MNTRVKNIKKTPSNGVPASRSDPSPAPALPPLPPQQAAVAKLTAEGLSDGEIAAALGLSEETIGSYLKVIFKRFNVHSRTALVALLLTANPLSHDSADGTDTHERGYCQKAPAVLKKRSQTKKPFEWRAQNCGQRSGSKAFMNFLMGLQVSASEG